MKPRLRAGLTLGPLLALAALLAGCSGAPAPATAAHRPPAAKEDAPSVSAASPSTVAGQLMVTLPPAPLALWNRTTAELHAFAEQSIDVILAAICARSAAL